MRAGFFFVLLGAFGANAAPIGYARASAHYLEDSRPSRYHALHVLDGRPATAWCSPAENPNGVSLAFGFKAATRIDEIRVHTGNGATRKTFRAFGRAKAFSFKGPEGARTFQLSDEPGFQSIPFEPPLSGQQFFLEVTEAFPGDGSQAPVCLSDVIFYFKGRPQNGAWLLPKLRFDRPKSAVLGTWFAGFEGAPDRFLSFYFDGTFAFRAQPFARSEGKPQRLGGKYRVSGHRLTLVLANGNTHRLAFSREFSEGKALMKLSGKGPPGFVEAFRDTP